MNIENAIKNKTDFSGFLSVMGGTLPLLHEFKNTRQDPVWHGEGDVEIHTNMVLEEAYEIIENEASHLSQEKKKCLVLSALLHDICKPITTKEKEINGETKIVAPKHEYMGMGYLFHKLQHFNPTTQKDLHTVLGLVGYHQIPKLLVIKNENKWKYYDLARKADTELLYYLEIADIRGRVAPDKKEQLEYLELFKMQCEEYDCFGKFINPVKSESTFVKEKGFRDLVNGNIFMPEESESKYYTQKNNHSLVYILCGLSGSGKSTWARKQNMPIISLDGIREEFGGTLSRKYEGQVLQEAKKRLKKHLAKKENVIYDATNIRKDFRTKISSLVEAYGGFSHVVCFSNSIDKIIDRDIKRKDSVGKEIIYKQENAFQFPEIEEADKITFI